MPGRREGGEKRRPLFAREHVALLRATEEDVERFCVEAGNDEDPRRRKRYPHMRAAVAPGCRLTEIALRILRSRFGEVVVEEKPCST